MFVRAVGVFSCFLLTACLDAPTNSSSPSEVSRFGNWEVVCKERCYVHHRQVNLSVFINAQNSYQVELQSSRNFHPGTFMRFDSFRYDIPNKFEFLVSGNKAVLRAPYANEMVSFMNGAGHASIVVSGGNSGEPDSMMQVWSGDSPSGEYPTGLGDALEYAHEQNGIEFQKSSFSGGVITLGGKDNMIGDLEVRPRPLTNMGNVVDGYASEEARRNPRQSTNSRDGTSSAACTKAALDAEATRVISSSGQPPRVASAAWQHGYDLTKTLIDLTQTQARRCPNIDLNYALQFHTSNLRQMEGVGRAAGWL